MKAQALEVYFDDGCTSFMCGDRSAADLLAAAAFLASSSFCSFLSFVRAAEEKASIAVNAEQWNKLWLVTSDSKMSESGQQHP